MILDRFFIPEFDPSDYCIELRKLTASEHLINLWKEKQEITGIDVWKYLRKIFIISWIIKLNFNSKYKLPMNREEQEWTKPLGVLYSEVWKACKELHSFTGGEYRNAAHWFTLILIEARVEGSYLGTKGKNLEAIRSENGLLAEFINPFEESYLHTHKLFALLLKLSEKNGNDVLRKEVLEPIKKARKRYATNYTKPIYQVPIFEDEREYLQQPGRGSGKRELRRFSLDELKETIEQEESQGKNYPNLKLALYKGL